MDINLNWHTHVEKISKKISSKIGILRRVKPFLTIDLSKTMFNVIVLPHFTYCDIIRVSSDETNISRLQKLQNTCARVILNENRRSHVQPMLDSLSWMPIIDLIKYHTLVAVYKCTHGFAPSYLHNTFMQISRIHSYSTRQANLAHLYTRKPKLTKFKQSYLIFWLGHKIKVFKFLLNPLTLIAVMKPMFLSFCVVACASVYSPNCVSLYVPGPLGKPA